MDQLASDFSDLKLNSVRRKILLFVTPNTISYYAKRGFNHITMELPSHGLDEALLAINEINSSHHKKLMFMTSRVNNGLFLKIYW